MELTFTQQAFLTLIGSSVVTSLLTTYLNNKSTNRRLRDQWEREKEERLEQWRREDEARRREWKREYRKELLYPFLEKVDSIVRIAGMLMLESEASSAVRAAGAEPPIEMPRFDRLQQLAEAVFSVGPIGIEDRTFRQWQKEFRETASKLMRVTGEEPEGGIYYHQLLEDIANKLHKRAEEWLEETFD